MAEVIEEVVVKEEASTPEVELSERESIYKAYNEAQPEGITEPTADTEAKTEEAPSGSVDEGEKLTPAIEPDSKGDEEKPKKMVPYDALHEERERRKTLQGEVETLRSQIEKMSSPAKEEPVMAEGFDATGEVIDFDAAIKSMRKINLELKNDLETVKGKSNAIEDTFQAARVKEAKGRFEQRLTDTSTSLVEEGYPGFKEFLPLVKEEVYNLIAENPDNEILMDNEAGWMKIYKEKVFPKIRASVGDQLRKETIDKKMELKGKANLVSTPGKVQPKESAKTEEWTKNDYMKMRQRYNTEEL